MNISAIEQVKADILIGKTKLLFVAPESLTKEENVEFLRNVKISFYAVDEAHCISEWGHDFRPEYRRIRPIINEIGKAPLIALTATATPKVQHDIQKNLGMVNAKVFKSSFNRPNLYYEVRAKTANVDKDIIKFIKANPEKSGIIYCLSRKKVEELAEILQANGINARPYHAGMDSATRTQNQDDFLMERIDVIVATIAFGMGIDKPDVRYVIHYDMPKSLEGYYQETGRAGRDGGEGQCITFYSNKDLQKLEGHIQKTRLKIKNKPEVFGRQLIMNERDEVIGEEEHLLIVSSGISVEEVAALVKGFGGIPIPAHIDKQANGIIGILGAFDYHLGFEMIECSVDSGVTLPQITDSDAHYLWDIAEAEHFIEAETCSARGVFEALKKMCKNGE